jgi:hypothetical protein
MRRRLVNGKWQKHRTPEGEPLDQLMEDNIAAYTKYVEARIMSLKEFPSIGIDAIPVKQEPLSISDLQLSLWPSLRASA